MKCVAGVRRVDPGVKVLLATGYYPEERAWGRLQREAQGLIRKPYNMNDLLRAVRNALTN